MGASSAKRLLLALAALGAPARTPAFSLLHGVDEPGDSVAAVMAQARRWSAPRRFGSTDGLGGGLSFALDERFCDIMLPRFLEENAEAAWASLDPLLMAQHTGCEQILDAMRRAFDSWSANHPYISFQHDTAECAGQPDCDSTEVFVTVFTAERGGASGMPEGALDSAGEKAALAQVRAFAEEPARGILWDEHARNGTGDARLMPGINVLRADLRFNQSMCWYLDNAFCALFNEQRDESSGSSRRSSGGTALIGVCITLWALGVLYLCRLAYLCAHGKLRTFWTHDVPDDVFEGIGRRERALYIAAKFRPERIALAVSLVVVLPLLWSRVVLPCVQCYDFEASAVHEVGHLLGVGHPHEAPALRLVREDEQTRRDVACGRGVNGSLETYGGTALGEGGYSIMAAVTQFNAKACIGQDDLDALNALYPTCAKGETLGPPMCVKTRRSLGAARLLGTVLFPALIASTAVFVLLHAVRRNAKRARDALERYLDAAVVVPGAAHVRPEVARRIAEMLGETEAELRRAEEASGLVLATASAPSGARTSLSRRAHRSRSRAHRRERDGADGAAPGGAAAAAAAAPVAASTEGGAISSRLASWWPGGAGRNGGAAADGNGGGAAAAAAGGAPSTPPGGRALARAPGSGGVRAPAGQTGGGSFSARLRVMPASWRAALGYDTSVPDSPPPLTPELTQEGAPAASPQEPPEAAARRERAARQARGAYVGAAVQSLAYIEAATAAQTRAHEQARARALQQQHPSAPSAPSAPPPPPAAPAAGPGGGSVGGVGGVGGVEGVPLVEGAAQPAPQPSASERYGAAHSAAEEEAMIRAAIEASLAEQPQPPPQPPQPQPPQPPQPQPPQPPQPSEDPPPPFELHV